MPATYIKPSGWRKLRAISIVFPIIVLLVAWGVTLQRLNADESRTLAIARAQQSNLVMTQ